MSGSSGQVTGSAIERLLFMARDVMSVATPLSVAEDGQSATGDGSIQFAALSNAYGVALKRTGK